MGTTGAGKTQEQSPQNRGISDCFCSLSSSFMKDPRESGEYITNKAFKKPAKAKSPLPKGKPKFQIFIERFKGFTARLPGER